MISYFLFVIGVSIFCGVIFLERIAKELKKIREELQQEK